MSDKERDENYLERIIEHCEKIESARKRFGDDFESFENDEAYKDVVNMNIFQIGELSNLLSNETKSRLSEIPWKQIYGIRNIIAHAYVIVEDEIVWNTIIKDIPELKERIKRGL